ncbi:hypothetical protein M409DRAFT_27592 [Zasmidium cellare ATCC 36951]|uniref:Uncharacterized protein n=1 Tax=Zasmidium cellare ATCC 36951 TaxID=1080233 RepID=A0A6A6C4K4_ZASCE|nr:uncharacterized protein M409DRAFT_27592 [Zasmidium cellare ATCC 36951]KAF2161863.1 hypothetical protein M409DRAFT_27592 [Zasmidium cellare ATCC 36951]
MAQFKPVEKLFTNLKNKVIVVTGGSTGIGAATVRILGQQGAHIHFGDINASAAEDLTKEVPSSSFVQCDVTKYNDIYSLFKKAHDKHGRIDHAISCAGIFESGNLYDPKLTIETVGQEPANTKTLDVNLLGSVYFSRIAAVFLRTDLKKGAEDKSLLLLSSVNAWRESPGLFTYQASKHGIQGLLRSSRKTLFERDGLRVNAVCPGVTDTPLADAVIGAFKDNNLYWQTAESVAKIVVGLLATEEIHGKAYYIEGGDAWEVEDGIYKEQPRWLGEEATRRMRINAEAVQKGALVPKGNK